MFLRFIKNTALGCAVGLSALCANAGDYSDHPKAKIFVDKMVNEHGFDRKALQATLNLAVKKQSILDAISRPAEKTKPWHEYRKIFLGQKRIDQGVDFWKKNQAVLDSVSKHYQVEPEIIVAIIGVETRYGRYMGKYRVLDALATLGFDYPPRAKFFSGQLEQFLIMTKEQNQKPTELLGSYAGAMGYGQFIPSSFRRYARDYDGDGKADIWTNELDAIASVANYFKAFGWQYEAPVFAPAMVNKTVDKVLVNNSARPEKNLEQWKGFGVVVDDSWDATLEAKLLSYDQSNGLEHLLGFNNYYVITRYNRSRMYARAVWELSQNVREAYEAASK